MSGWSWASAPLAPQRLDLRAVVGRGAGASLSMYHPYSRRARLALAATASGIRLGLARRCPPPVDDVEDLAKVLGIDPDSAASMRSARKDRIVISFASGNRLHGVAKVGRLTDEGLRHEAELLASIPQPKTFAVPKLRWAGEWNDSYVVATNAAPTRRQRADRPANDVVEVCVELTLGIAGIGPLTHGDLTPWNLIGDRPPTLIDWEDGRRGAEPIFDLAHYVTQQGSLGRRFDPPQAVRLLVAPGSPGWRYLEAVDVDPQLAPELILSYTEKTAWMSGEKGWRYRTLMAEAISQLAR